MNRRPHLFALAAMAATTASIFVPPLRVSDQTDEAAALRASVRDEAKRRSERLAEVKRERRERAAAKGGAK